MSNGNGVLDEPPFLRAKGYIMKGFLAGIVESNPIEFARYTVEELYRTYKPVGLVVEQNLDPAGFLEHHQLGLGTIPRRPFACPDAIGGGRDTNEPRDPEPNLRPSGRCINRYGSQRNRQPSTHAREPRECESVEEGSYRGRLCHSDKFWGNFARGVEALRMTVFSHDQMNRSLFEEPTPAIEREHPLDGPHGFLLGGGANLTLPEIGQQYFDAADALVELITSQEVEDYKIGNPVIYLYRHSIELFLKAILPGTWGHNLEALAGKFEAFVRAEFAATVPDWIISRLKEISRLDPDSATFRYNQNSDLLHGGEFHVDLLHLQSAMHALNTALVGVIAAVACGEAKREA
jgi:hypothetical protein